MSAADTKNVAALMAKSALNGMKTRRPAARAQPPTFARVGTGADQRVRLLDMRAAHECGEERAVRRVEVARRGGEQESREHEPPEREIACEFRERDRDQDAPRKRSAAIIVRRLSSRSARRPPCKPKRSAGMLSASRTTSTPAGPATSSANHMSAMYWNA
jgi:hypothetical protein